MTEEHFAAAVFNAKWSAVEFEKATGFARTASDEIDGAIANLCICMQAIGYSDEDINQIIKRHVIEHRDGTYSPRHRPNKKVVRFPWQHRIRSHAPVSA
jgi:hypothetical protein